VTEQQPDAPGAPGAPLFWNPGSKDGVGTALTDSGLLWFTLGRGTIEEVYFPHADHPCVRDFGLAVADGTDFFAWEKADTDSQVAALERGVPAYSLVNRCRRKRFQIQKGVISHPDRPVLLQQTQFTPSDGHELALYAILNPHLGPHANAWVGDYKGTPMLFATGEQGAVALACSAPWLRRSVGFVGESDGRHDLAEHKRLTRTYDRADGGNVALTGQISRPNEECLLVVAFGLNADEAGLHARAALFDGFDAPLVRYARAWANWQSTLLPLDGVSRTAQVYRASTAVLRTHEAKHPPGAAVASLTVPFGEARKGEDTGGYHLVWPRDLVECAGGLLAAGDSDRARAALSFLESTQEPDGHWAQNMWLNGKPYRNGVQMDETALAVLLLDLARREGAIQAPEADRYWPVVRRAAGYLVRNGPATPEDRWEHDGGYSPFTLGAEIAALLVAADLATESGEPALAEYLRETADVWNAGIEDWTYVTGTELAKRVGVEGYYVRLGESRRRIGPPQPDSDPRDGADESSVSPDALALVRFGLRAADDPRVVNTVKVIDAVLKVDLGFGPGWRRYTGDRYGERPDGGAFDHKHGVGRAWPLFAGERGHYELAAGRPQEAERMLHLMERAATDTGLIPEQSWDADDIPEKGLFRGRPTTSACPLSWAHAEHVKLLRSLRDGRVFDLPPQTALRYIKDAPRPRMRVWRFKDRLTELENGYVLRVELREPALVRWSANGWRDTHDLETRDAGLGVFVADLPTDQTSSAGELVFTFHWTTADRWEGKDFKVAIKVK
jgi:glucoamylase